MIFFNYNRLCNWDNMEDFVKVISDKKFSDEEEKVLERFKELQLAMIEKDEEKLKEIFSDDYYLTHMSGRKQSKDDFIEEIMDGTLNYYGSTISYPEIIVNSNKAIFIADVTLDAKVYGAKGVWTLNTRANLEKKEGQWYFGKWEN